MKKFSIYLVLIVGILFLPLAALSMGRYHVALPDVAASLFGQCEDKVINTIIWNLRLPRTVASLLIGSALAVSGTAYQGVFQNPLVSPDLLGVSSGACVGASIAILCGWSNALIITSAFVSGIVSVALAVLFASFTRSRSSLILILAGVIVGRFADALFAGVKYFADSESELGEIVYWQMGSVSKVTMSKLRYMLPVILICLFAMFCLRWRIDLLSVGERDAHSLGVNIVFERYLIIFLSTLLTAASVSVSGSIGWLGLVIPHLSRGLVGADSKSAVPVSMMLGAIFLLIIDTLARTLSTLELPLGVLTGFIGTPLFVVIFFRQRTEAL